jgi:hypothetical protein
MRASTHARTRAIAAAHVRHRYSALVVSSWCRFSGGLVSEARIEPELDGTQRSSSVRSVGAVRIGSSAAAALAQRAMGADTTPPGSILGGLVLGVLGSTREYWSAHAQVLRCERFSESDESTAVPMPCASPLLPGRPGWGFNRYPASRISYKCEARSLCTPLALLLDGTRARGFRAHRLIGASSPRRILWLHRWGEARVAY